MREQQSMLLSITKQMKHQFGIWATKLDLVLNLQLKSAALLTGHDANLNIILSLFLGISLKLMTSSRYHTDVLENVADIHEVSVIAINGIFHFMHFFNCVPFHLKCFIVHLYRKKFHLYCKISICMELFSICIVNFTFVLHKFAC